jgi:exopolyphosphatase/pppGpp-phosphohydrolase
VQSISDPTRSACSSATRRGWTGDYEIRTIARAGEPCRLAKGLGATGRIDPALAERAGEIAREFLARARSLGARRIVIGATAALRDAANGRDIASGIERLTELPVRILTGEEERSSSTARWSWASEPASNAAPASCSTSAAAAPKS